MNHLSDHWSVGLPYDFQTRDQITHGHIRLPTSQITEVLTSQWLLDARVGLILHCVIIHSTAQWLDQNVHAHIGLTQWITELLVAQQLSRLWSEWIKTVAGHCPIVNLFDCLACYKKTLVILGLSVGTFSTRSMYTGNLFLSGQFLTGISSCSHPDLVGSHRVYPDHILSFIPLSDRLSDPWRMVYGQRGLPLIRSVPYCSLRSLGGTGFILNISPVFHPSLRSTVWPKMDCIWTQTVDTHQISAISLSQITGWHRVYPDHIPSLSSLSDRLSDPWRIVYGHRRLTLIRSVPYRSLRLLGDTGYTDYIPCLSSLFQINYLTHDGLYMDTEG
jgi:hypothetical protein